MQTIPPVRIRILKKGNNEQFSRAELMMGGTSYPGAVF